MKDKWTPNTGKMPIKFESAIRVNRKSYPEWDIPDGEYRERSDELYEKEWQGGSGQMRNVANAAINSGLGSFSVSLRNVVGRIAAYLIHESDDKVRLLDVGAGSGGSVKTVYSQLHPSKWNKIYSLLIDPSKKNREDARKYLKNTLGLYEGKDFDFIVGRDKDIPKKVNKGDFDIAIQVAAIHHHAYLDNPFKAVAYALRKKGFGKDDEKEKYGGVFISGDWHSRIWESPAMVYRWLLKRMKWPKKKEGIESFLKQFPQAIKEIGRMGSFDLENLKAFSRYYQTWNEDRQKLISEGKYKPDEDFYAMEGHCPVEIYENEMKDAGFLLDTPIIGRVIEERITDDNPYQVFPNHNLNMVLTGQLYEDAA
jgi:SAM-dependent methyltransferase